MFTSKRFYILLVLSCLSLSAVLSTTACGSEPTAEEHMEGAEDHDHSEDHSEDRVPNEGRTIRILSPQEGAEFSQDEDIVIEVEIENFRLNEEGSHWHVYANGESYGMVVGNTTRQVVRGLLPGEYEIEAYLAIGTHEELEDPGRVHIVVTE